MENKEFIGLSLTGNKIYLTKEEKKIIKKNYQKIVKWSIIGFLIFFFLYLGLPIISYLLK